MKTCHNIHIRELVHDGEDNGMVLQAMEQLVGFDLEKEKLKIRPTRTTSVDDKLILIHEIVLQKDRHINMFLKQLNSKLKPEQKELLIRQENRLDEEGYFYIRLDKPKLFEGIYHITDEGNCYHIKMCIAAYPKTRAACLAKVKEIFAKH